MQLYISISGLSVYRSRCSFRHATEFRVKPKGKLHSAIELCDCSTQTQCNFAASLIKFYAVVVVVAVDLMASGRAAGQE